MQILYVGNGNYKHRGARYYDAGRKLCNGFTRNGHNVYFLSDRDTARSATIFGSRKIGIRHCNKVFLDTCINFSPDLIVIGHADIISNASLEQARVLLPNVKIAQFNVDAIFNPHTVEQIAVKAALCDATFVTTGGSVLKKFSHAKGVAAYMPNPVDSSMEWPLCHERSDQEHDVFWACRAMKGSYEGDPRIELPLHLEKSGQVDIDYHGMNGKEPLYNASYYRHIANAKMGLNISNTCYRGNTDRAAPEDLYLYSSDRISHYMGSGLLTFTTHDNRLEELFAEDKELIFFSTKEELLEKVIYFKNHDNQRKQVARAGWEKSHLQLNDRLVAKYLIETTFRVPLTEPYVWPATTY
jgi:hypothetical protein